MSLRPQGASPALPWRRRGVSSRRGAKVGDEWMRMLLFVVDDFGAMRLNTFTRDSGAWPPPAGTMLIERQASIF